MKGVYVLLIAMFLVATVFSGAALADEWYNGETGDQPATGAIDSPGDGLPSDDVPDTGETDRTRNKDN